MMTEMTVTERIAALRGKMKEHGIDAWLVPTDDFHSSEYVGDYFKCRQYLSGFTGSAGTLVVMKDTAGLWTDGRYFLQAEAQLAGSGIDLYKMGQEGVPTVEDFLVDALREGQCLGFDGRTVSAREAAKLSERLKAKGVRLDYTHDLSGEVWTDRPALSARPVMLLGEEYAGRSRRDKLAGVREAMARSQADYFVLASLDDIAWLLNIRGDDVKCNPVVLSYVVVTAEKVLLFANEAAFDEECRSALEADGVKLLPYNNIYLWIGRIGAGSTVMLDGGKVNYALRAGIPEGVKVVDTVSPTLMAKAVKNPVEMENIRKAHLKDGVAVTRFMYWLKKRAEAARQAGSQVITDEEGTPVTEIGAAEKLSSFRWEQEHYMGPSFDTIAGFGPHGAIVHYSATPETDCRLKMDDFLLVDSGGQYLEGTTDITRTFALGDVDEEHRKYFTLVLKGNLNLAAARFLYGCRGINLDYICRRPLWDLGLDYNHGTGHGVGYFLNVHEGPNGFRWRIVPERNDSCVLEEGMVTSDEPGLYLEGKFGIRHENLLLCRKGEKTPYGQFMYFETLTLVPFDLDGIDISLLNEEEIKLLNDYHAMVNEKIAPYLPAAERAWLKEATRPVSR
mgnify:CR=1 FL=1